MMLTKLYLAFTLILVWLCGINIPVSRSQQLGGLSKKVKTFSANGISPLEAILLLGEQENIPLGIVCSDNALLSSEISIDESRTTVMLLLASILRNAPTYQAVEGTDGVVRVADLSKISTNKVLDFTFPRFQHIQGDTTSLSEALWGQFQEGINPERHGYGGVLRVPPGDRELPRIDLVNANIEDVLDWMIFHHGSMAWIMWPPPAQITDVPQYRLWNLVYYPSASKIDNKLCCIYLPSDMQGIPKGVKERLGATATK